MMDSSNRPFKRSLNGILLLNKAQGSTSNAALQKVKYLYAAKKAGHTGSLDPLATGMLPLCFGEATKLSQFSLNADKHYRAHGCLGIKTDTSDSLGTIISQVSDVQVSLAMLEDTLQAFRGQILQTPSMYSALKHQGRPLYQYARQGVEIERSSRSVMIYELQLLGFDGLHFEIDVLCSKGTYIRNLVEDIGDALKVGAHLTGLNREYTAGFEKLPMVSVSELEAMDLLQRDAQLLPLDAGILWMDKVQLNPQQLQAISHGQSLESIPIAQDQLVRLYSPDDVFVGIAVGDSGVLKARRLIAF